MRNIVLIFIAIVGLSACNKDDDNQAEIDKNVILQYIADHNLDAVEGEEGLYYVVDVEGTGDACNSSSTVKTTYSGYLTNGNIFDQGTIDNFPLQNAIRGWQVGIPKFKEGGNGILLIPSAIGYGTNGSGSGSIPPNAVIIFDIQLIKVY